MANELGSIIFNQLQPRQVNENHLPFNHPWFMFPSKKVCRLCTSPEKKKNHVFCHLGILFLILIFYFFPQRLPKALRWWFCARHCYDYWKTPEQGIGGLLVNDLWFEATFFITLASQFATPYVNLFSLGSVDVMRFRGIGVPDFT